MNLPNTSLSSDFKYRKDNNMDVTKRRSNRGVTNGITNKY